MENSSAPTPVALEVAPPRKKKSPIVPLVRTFQRKALLILACLGTTSTVAWMAAADDPPTYGGSFEMLVEPVTSEARVSEPAALTRGERSANDFSLDYPTQLELLQSPKILLPVYEQILQKYPDFTYLDLITNLAIERTGGKVRADQTKILLVSYRNYNPELVEFVLNKLAEKFLTYSLEDRRTRIGEGVKFIEDQLPALQRRVNQLQEQLERIQQQHDLVDPGSQGGDIFRNLRSLADRQQDTERELQELQTLYGNLQRQLQLDPNEAIAASALSQDPRYQQVLSAISQIESQIATESARFHDESPVIQRLRERQTNLVTLRDREAQRILGQTLGNTRRNPQTLTFQDSVRVGLIQQLVSTGNQIRVMQTRQQMLGRNRAAAEREAAQFPRIARTYNEIQRQLNIATRTLDQLQIQRETLRVEAAQNQVPWEIISPPLLPRDEEGVAIPDPVGSRKKQMLGVVAGLVLGLGLSLLIEKLQNIFHTAKDVEDIMPAPLLGVVPRYNGMEPIQLGAMAPEVVETLDPSAFPFLEAFNSLYASLCFEYAEGALRSLVICSPSAGDGKTTIALYLAQTAASMGQRVLLVDANFRNPQIHSRLGLSNEQGLSTVLQRKQAAERVIQFSPLVETLSVLTSGPVPPGSSRLLASPRMKQLMGQLQADFDLVIYDTAHLHGVIDSNFLAANTDGLLLVSAVQQTKRSVMLQTLKQMEGYHLPILGAIANGVKSKVEEVEEMEEIEEVEAVEEVEAIETAAAVDAAEEIPAEEEREREEREEL